MNDDLLVSLKKYKTTAKKDSVENFITESFAWILRNYNNFSEYFLNFISKELEINDNFDSDNWETQVNFNGYYPDLVYYYSNKTKAIVFEIKAYSHLHNNQLDNYRTYSEKYFSEYKLILITANETQHFQNPDLSLCWRNIYKLIETFKNKYSEDLFMLDSFLKLLEHEGLGPIAPISHESILYYFKSQDFIPKIKKMSNFKKDVFSNIVSSDILVAEYQDGWGRIGVDLLGRPWIPGIFVGFMLDGKDHKTKPVMGDISPDFEIIIEFDTKLHSIYPDNLFYINLVNELSDEINKIGDLWDFYHHIQDKSLVNYNYWHPIHIRKPILELFRGTKTWEEQEKRVNDAINQILPLVINSENFKKLRIDFFNIITSD